MKTQPSSQRACATEDLWLYLLTQLSIQTVFYKCMENSLTLTRRFILQLRKFHSSLTPWAKTEVEPTSSQLTGELS